MILGSSIRELDTSAGSTAEMLLPVFQDTIPHRHRLEPVPDAAMLHSNIQPRTTSERRVLAAFDPSGALVAYTLVTRNRLANNSLADIRELRVASGQGRHGYGTALLDAAKQLARQMNCVRMALSLPFAPEETTFPQKHGGALAYQEQRTVLELGAIDVDRYRELASSTSSEEPTKASAQYETIRWTDHCPDEVVQAHIVCRAAMNDEPGAPAKTTKPMTPAELRQLENARVAYGQRRHTVAVLAPNGEMAAFTQVAVVADSDSSLAPMGNTAVARGHRGYGLALRIKAELGLWMLDREPQVQLIDCWNNVENRAMSRINQILGWEVTGRSSTYTFDL